MKFITKILLGCALVGVLAGVYYVDKRKSDKKELQMSEQNFAVLFKPDDVVQFKLESPENTIVFERQNKEALWRIVSPRSLAAENSLINSLVGSLSIMRVQQELVGKEKVLAGDPIELAKYELLKPSVTFTVTLQNKETKKLMLGKVAEIGKKNYKSFELSRYALNPNKKHLLIVDAVQFASLDLSNLETFRSKRIGQFNYKDVAILDILTARGNIQLKKENDRWKQLWPEASDKVNSAFVEEFLRNYQGLTVEKLIDPTDARMQGEDPFRLKNPAAVVTVKNAAGDALQTFRLGLTKEGIFVPMSDGIIGQIGLESWPELIPSQGLFTASASSP